MTGPAKTPRSSESKPEHGLRDSAASWARSQPQGTRHLDLEKERLEDVSGRHFDSAHLAPCADGESVKQSLGQVQDLLDDGARLAFSVSLSQVDSENHSHGILTALRVLQQRFAIEEARAIGSDLAIVAVKRKKPLSKVPTQSHQGVVEAVSAALEFYALARAEELKTKERQLRQELRNAQRELRKRTVQLLESAQTQGDGDAERQRLKQQLRVAETKTEKVRNTLSFRLGYALIHRTKSIRGVASLPRALWEVNQEAGRRRNGQSAVDLARTRARTFVKDVRSKVLGGVPGTPSQAVDLETETRVAKHYELPASVGPLANGQELAALRVACIMDEFTLTSFAPECQLLPLSVDNWEADLKSFSPDLLFVESAWRGKDDGWQSKIGHISPELRGIVSWCRDEANIPAAFWCKEDPVHFSTFINTAALFDFVFTTDIDCVHRYKALLGHERVYALPFACQPSTQNPIEKYERKDAACFAGAYYTHYPERQRDFLRMVLKLLELRPVEIYDRNFGKSDPGYQFPASFDPLIQGTLAFSEIDKAYKGYDYAININSIKYSQSMFARRVFEVLASNTITVSNYSRGIQLMFGDLVIATDDANHLKKRLDELAADPNWSRRFRLLGLRKVLSQHTYQDRLAYMASKVFEVPAPRLMPSICVVAYAKTTKDKELLCSAFAAQDYDNKRLLLVGRESLAKDLPVGCDFLSLAEHGDKRIAEVAEAADYVACFVTDDHYGETYLLDLALGTRYFPGEALGKSAHYQWTDAGPQLQRDGEQYRPPSVLLARSSLARPASFSGCTLRTLSQKGATLELDCQDALAVDEFSYCLGGGTHAEDPRLAVLVGTQASADLGISCDALAREAESIQVEMADPTVVGEVLGPDQLQEMFKAGRQDLLEVQHTREGMLIKSELGFKMSQYVYMGGERPLHTMNFSTERARFHLDVSSGLTVQAVFIFFTTDKKRLGHTINCASANHEVEVPAGASRVRFGLLVSGRGRVLVRRLVLGSLLVTDPVRIFGLAKTLLLTNNYPAPDDLYKNAFVHRRVLKYQDAGHAVDVFRMRSESAVGYHDFEGVPVTSGTGQALQRVLAKNEHETVFVHFLDKEMWAALESELDHLRVVVWIHGFEVQAWHRRKFNYTTEAEIEDAKRLGERRRKFWQPILENQHENLRFVFVSQHLADEVQEDFDLNLAPEKFSVIHNPIDTDLFSFESKAAEQRTQILSIRPYAARTYANDLAVQAILALAEKPFFEELEFRMIGDGELFDQTLEPLRKFSNVIIERRFLPQSEVAELHKEYGLFLVPSRMDSQGVSRDEAMASGLVPITSRVAAIPEFVDEDCGFLAPAEDAVALAEAIEALYHDPDRFLRLSAAAAARVRGQSGTDKTIARELSLLSSSSQATRA